MLIYGLNNRLIDEVDSFGAWLRLALANSEMTQTDLAKKIRVCQTTVSGWTLNKNKPCYWATVKLLCEIVDADPELVWRKWF